VTEESEAPEFPAEPSTASHELEEPQTPAELPKFTDVLQRSWAFTQLPLLTADGFSRRLRERGISIDARDLPRLERLGAIVPAFRVTRDLSSGAVSGQPAPQVRARLQYSATTSAELDDLYSRGMVADGAPSRYRAPKTETTIVDGTTTTRTYPLYSPYQLLAGEHLREVAATMRSRSAWGRAVRESYVRVGAPLDRNAAIVAETLAPRYRPEVVERITLDLSGSSWYDFAAAFAPLSELAFLGASADDLSQIAFRLLSRADAIDPNRPFFRLIRLMSRSQLLKAKNLSLLAVDLRITAEMILLFLEDVAAAGGPDVLPVLDRRQSHPFNSRLKPQDEDLDSILTDYGLSPHPDVVLALEGETEMILTPEAMDEMGIPQRRNYIQLFNGKTVSADFGLLATYVAVPVAGQERFDGARLLTRPITRILIAVDPEGDYESSEKREAKRQTYIERIYQSLDPSLQTATVRKYIDSLVEIFNWPAVFEFAHFSNGELARAINRAWKKVNAAPPRKITAALVQQIRGTSQNIENLWSKYRVGVPSKPKVAMELKTVLRRRIREATESHANGSVPIMEALERARRMASQIPRQRLLVQLDEPDAE
jgi:hypothetical protein